MQNYHTYNILIQIQSYWYINEPGINVYYNTMISVCTLGTIYA
jgi:hypothetical protein